MIWLKDVYAVQPGSVVSLIRTSDGRLIGSRDLAQKYNQWEVPESELSWELPEYLDSRSKEYGRQLKKWFMEEEAPEQLLGNHKFLLWCYNDSYLAKQSRGINRKEKLDV